MKICGYCKNWTFQYFKEHVGIGRCSGPWNVFSATDLFSASCPGCSAWEAHKMKKAEPKTLFEMVPLLRAGGKIKKEYWDDSYVCLLPHNGTVFIRVFPPSKLFPQGREREYPMSFLSITEAVWLEYTPCSAEPEENCRTCGWFQPDGCWCRNQSSPRYGDYMKQGSGCDYHTLKPTTNLGEDW